MTKVFISYSHKDDSFREELEKHLSVLKRNKYIDIWTDRKIVAGENWGDAISSELEEAKIILLLISSDFLASDYCYDIEMCRAVEKHDNKEAIVIPIILRFCDWKTNTPFAKIQGLPIDGRPIKDWDDHDKAFYNVVEGIKKTLNLGFIGGSTIGSQGEDEAEISSVGEKYKSPDKEDELTEIHKKLILAKGIRNLKEVQFIYNEHIKKYGISFESSELGTLIDRAISMENTTATTIQERHNKPLIPPLYPKKTRAGCLLYLIVFFLIASVIYFFFIRKSNESSIASQSKEAEYRKGDSTNINNSNGIIGNHNSVNSNNTNNSTTNKIITVNNVYYVPDKPNQSVSEINLLTSDANVSKKMYRGAETFVRCSGEDFYQFRFNINKLVSKGRELYNIKWGDGTSDMSLIKLESGTTLIHNFPRGNSIMQIEVLDNGKIIETKKYNIFLGNLPSGGIASTGPTGQLCLGKPIELMLFGFKNNPPWTVYTLNVNDGSKPFSFLASSKDAIPIKHVFKRLPLKSDNNPSMDSMYNANQRGNYFVATLTIENPCASGKVSIGPLYVSNCK